MMSAIRSIFTLFVLQETRDQIIFNVPEIKWFSDKEPEWLGFATV